MRWGNTEEKRLRTVALKNAESVLLARRDAERKLLAAKEALERKTRELQASEERFRATFSQAAVGIGICDLDGHFVDVNPKFCEIVGYSRAELLKLTFTAITYTEDLRETEIQVRRLLGGEIPHYVLTKRYRRKDSSVVWSRTTVTLLRNAQGAADQLVGVIEDIGDRMHAEELGQASAAHLSALVASSEDAIISKTLDGTITTWNGAAERMFGYSAEEAIGQSIMLLIPPDRAHEEPQIIARLRRGERIEHYETVRVKKDGTRFEVSLSVSPITTPGGAIIGASKIARDITRQRETEEALREEIAQREKAESALREADRRKDEFLATLAHELRNPLAPIRQAALISRSPDATEAQKRWSHDVIERQVHQMALLLDDLLDISRITRGTLELRAEMTGLAAVINTAVETARPAIDAKGHALSIELPSQEVQFAADPLRVSQVLSNLLTNAAKYTDHGGRIQLRAWRDAEQVSISVCDTGIGIPADALGEVFAMFSQVESSQDRSEGGLGIGLALSKGLVALHGGSIEARSAGVGQGSEFIVRFPLRSLAVAPPGDLVADKETPAVQRRVLVADDNRAAAESLALLLQMEGHDVRVAYDGDEALEVFAVMQPDVALLDIGMPKMNGYEVARQARERSNGRKVTIIAVTGWGQDSDRANAVAAGFDFHFTKPVEIERLTQLLRSPDL